MPLVATKSICITHKQLLEFAHSHSCCCHYSLQQAALALKGAAYAKNARMPRSGILKTLSHYRHTNTQHSFDIFHNTLPSLLMLLQPAPPHVWLGPALPEAMGIFAMALAGPSGSALPTLRGNMKQPQRFKRVLFIGLGVMTTVCGLVGAVGYYYFGSGASQLITDDLETKSLLSHVKVFGVIRVNSFAMLLTCRCRL